MVKPRGSKNFDPAWWNNGGVKTCEGFSNRSDARRVMLDYQNAYGKKNAYVQQYGPYS
jgi:hypothetical protein